MDDGRGCACGLMIDGLINQLRIWDFILWVMWSESLMVFKHLVFRTWRMVVFFKIFIYLFIYLFLAVLGLRFCARAFSSCGERGPLFIAVRGPLTVAASPAAEHRLQRRRLSSCGPRAQLLRGMWDPPRPGLEPVSPALAGRFWTTAPPGKPWRMVLRHARWQQKDALISAHRTQFLQAWGCVNCILVLFLFQTHRGNQ